MSPGESCRYERGGSRFTFTIKDDGFGCVGGICSGRSITLNNFSAVKNTSGQWEIVSLPGGMTPTPPTPPPSTPTEFRNLDAPTAANAAIAIAKAADARPRAGSITQSSNVNDGITIDQVSVTAQHGASQNSYSIQNRSSWSISSSDGSPRAMTDVRPPFKGDELTKRIEGGTLYVDVYSDIEAPTSRQVTVSGGPSVRLDQKIGSTISGLTLDEVNARRGDGTLDGVPGIFSCNRAGGRRCPAFFGNVFDPTGTDWIFTPHGTTRTETSLDTDYLAGGVWLFVPDDATNADDFTFGAFADGNDPFQQDKLMALQGTATYDGVATGVYSDKSNAGTDIGYWDADVTLNANFGGRSDLGSISGSVTEFEADGESYAGSMSLETADIGSSGSGFFDGEVSGTVDGTSYSGRWGGQFFGNGEADGKPGSVAGTLGGRSADGSENFVGVFGGYKQ